MKTNHSTSRPKGFTLIELLVVISIIVILAGLSVTGYNYVIQRQSFEQAKLDIALISNALEDYKADNGEYPDVTTTNDLYKALYYDGVTASPPDKIYVPDLDPDTNKRGWTEGTGANTKIIDPWGVEYIYRRGDHADAENPDFDLLSKGKDGIKGNLDDVDNF